MSYINIVYCLSLLLNNVSATVLNWHRLDSVCELRGSSPAGGAVARSDSCRHRSSERVNEKLNSLKPHMNWSDIYAQKNVPRYVEPGLSPATDTPVRIRTPRSIFGPPPFCLLFGVPQGLVTALRRPVLLPGRPYGAGNENYTQRIVFTRCVFFAPVINPICIYLSQHWLHPPVENAKLIH